MCACLSENLYHLMMVESRRDPLKMNGGELWMKTLLSRHPHFIVNNNNINIIAYFLRSDELQASETIVK